MDIGIEGTPFIAEPLVEPVPVTMPQRHEREINLPDPSQPVEMPEKVPAR